MRPVVNLYRYSPKVTRCHVGKKPLDWSAIVPFRYHIEITHGEWTTRSSLWVLSRKGRAGCLQKSTLVSQALCDDVSSSLDLAATSPILPSVTASACFPRQYSSNSISYSIVPISRVLPQETPEPLRCQTITLVPFAIQIRGASSPATSASASTVETCSHTLI